MKVSENKRLKEEFVGFAQAHTITILASEILAGELAAKRGDMGEALGHLEVAVRMDDALMYNEPPDWLYPPRHSLGAILLEGGRADEAELVYSEDLKRNPDNGFALFGLWQSLVAQNKEEEGKEALDRFSQAWSRADITLTTSRF
ncbi:MAG: hypothetical protein IIC82_06840 [Chloroflexi bacterium]|nr:hypothetical protein [Chloroflexota bacterium]